MTVPQVIPLFPLPNVVLFPRVSLPLHVFEPRYKKMVADALAGPQLIGMTLLRPGWEADYQGRPAIYASGCVGRIEKCDELEHGRYNILLKGLSRFRIVEEHGGEPYRLATVQLLDEEPGDPVILEEARRELLAAIGRAADGPTVLVLQPDLPHDVFVNALCQSLELHPVEQTYGGSQGPRVH
jgi:Lon protease-like protein